MKSATKILRTFSLVIFISILTSCNGQTKSESNQKAKQSGQWEITLPKGVSPHTMFRCSFKDKDGNIWFGTTGAGIYKCDGNLFIRYAEKEGLTNLIVYSITQDKNGNIWTGTDDGIYYSNGDNFLKLSVPIADNSNKNFTSKNKLPVYCVAVDSKNNIWFGTENTGLWCYDGKKFKNFRCINNIWTETSTNDNSQVGFIQSLLTDKRGNVWISSLNSSLQYFDGVSFHSINVDHLRNSEHKKGIEDISTGHFFQMIEDKSGNIWLSSRDDGVCRYNGTLLESFTEKDGFSDNSSSCVCETKDGKIWIGSLGKSGTRGEGLKGLTVYDGKTFVTIPSSEMRNNEVWTIIEDNKGIIWIGTREFGLFKYDGKIFKEVTK